MSDSHFDLDLLINEPGWRSIVPLSTACIEFLPGHLQGDGWWTRERLIESFYEDFIRAARAVLDKLWNKEFQEKLCWGNEYNCHVLSRLLDRYITIALVGSRLLQYMTFRGYTGGAAYSQVLCATIEAWRDYISACCSWEKLVYARDERILEFGTVAEMQKYGILSTVRVKNTAVDRIGAFYVGWWDELMSKNRDCDLYAYSNATDRKQCKPFNASNRILPRLQHIESMHSNEEMRAFTETASKLSKQARKLKGKK